MEESNVLGEDLPLPPARLFERLAQISGYTWDQSIEPFHSSYDNWHVFGIRHISDSDGTPTATTGSIRSSSARSSPKIDPRPAFRHHFSSFSEPESDVSSSRGDLDSWMSVIARISNHALRLEREFHMNKSIIQTSDPECKHTVRPIDFIRLKPEPGDKVPIHVSIFEAPGPNYLREVLNFGPAFYGGGGRIASVTSATANQLPLPFFLDFAIGAAECLELLHHGHQTVHGEIRADAFHYHQETGAVKLVNVGNGPRAFENGLTSEGWITLSREIGAKNKLQFIAPEQTGRLPTDPDSRTDIYSLGVLFWTMLVGRPGFDGDTPMDVIQNVLARRLPPVSSKRLDVPDAISTIIQRMTMKQIDERYHSVSGLKHDLLEVQKLLSNGDGEGLKAFEIAQKDVSSFFVLPCTIIGRQNEQDRVVKVIEKVLKRQQVANSKANAHALYSIDSNSSVSESRIDSFELADAGSSETSSQGVKDSRSNSTVGQLFYGSMNNLPPTSNPNNESPALLNKPSLPLGHSKNSIESRGSWETMERESFMSNGVGTSHYHDTLGPLARRRGSAKFRRRGRCEVISIFGPAGIGKSSLVQMVQPSIRKHGYFALAKFDQTRKAPFEPLIRAMSSLFRQIFSERDVSTEYHNSVRASIRPIWPMLQRMLDLPESLLSQPDFPGSKSTPSRQPPTSKAWKSELPFPDSASSNGSVQTIPHFTSHQISAEFLRGPTATKSLRFMNTFLEVLRALSHNKLICLCLEDLQNAGEESLDLITNIVSAKVRVVLMVTCRQEEAIPAGVRTVLDAENSYTTKITLLPLSEEDVLEYVAATMYQECKTVVPLAAVIQERSNGNPFYMREMLETCYRKHCLWFSWKVNAWEYDLDRVFTEFETEHYGQFLNMDFVTKKLQELPPASRAILAWGSLLGNSFSFSLVQKLLTGEFLYSSETNEKHDVTCPKRAQLFRQSEEDAISGLQILLQVYILVPGETDDEFRFSSDRHLQAAALMRECHNVQKMHFLIAQTVLKYDGDDEKTVHVRARHICQSIELIKERVSARKRYRNVLFQAAMTATESGARPTALWYYQNCLSLLQDDPWDDDSPDVYYEETLKIYVQSAEIFWYQGKSEDALTLLAETFAHAKTPACKTRSWILQSRLFAQRGDSLAAFTALKTSLIELGLELEETTWEACDADYKKIVDHLKTVDFMELLQRPLSTDPDLIATGIVLIEAMSAAFWTDALLFFQMAIQMITVHLKRGPFIQIGLGYTHLAMIVVSRFRDINFALKLADLSRSFLNLYRDDPYTQGRGWTIHTLFINHYQSPLRQSLSTLEGALEMTYAAGDRILSILNFGAMASTRLYIGMDMTEIESFCSYIGEEFDDWQDDLRGGTQILGARQVARALQGKTMIQSGYDILSDETHDTSKYMAFMHTRASNVERPHDIYWSMAMMPLYLYGHYQDAVTMGKKLETSMHELWSLREVALAVFYLSLSMIALTRENPTKETIESTVKTVMEYKKRIDCSGYVNDTNYGMWSLLMEAEACEISQNYPKAVQLYEAAIDHTQVHGFAIEEALAVELQAEFFIRRGAKRAARAVLQEAVSAWTRINATGKARHLSDKHEWLLRTAITSRTNDVGVQTSDSLSHARAVGTMDEQERQIEQRHGEKIKDERTREWLEPGKGPDSDKIGDLSSLGLDIIDLSSILEFSQVISSELQIDRSVSKMIEIILESAGGQADFAAIVINQKDGNGWSVVATGSNEHGVQSFPEGSLLTDVEDQVAQQVTLYTLRFKEPVFISNILEDERFSNVSETYLERNPMGKAIIVLPIMAGDHLMGSLYLEGQPHAFTQRNLVVLRLLSQQVGISIANALLFKEVRKVSASNEAMIESQKRALAQARAAEQKAKIAEAEAMRNVKLKEEAAKAKSMFLANVSHELRTPLNGVIGMSELLKGTTLNQEQEGYADSIRVCADTLLTVINDILDFSKLEAGKMKMFSVPLNLRETITEVVRALEYTNLERGLETIEDLVIPQDLLVLGDPVRLHQILMNLLSNSYKFTPKGSVTVRAKPDYESKDKIKITCSVSDTGIGISQEQLAKLFKPFSQADSSTARSYGGSGLGLSICKAMIENVLGGKIWLDSIPGKGTTVSFQLTFPKAPKNSTAAIPHVSAKDPDPMANWSHDSGSTAGTPPPCDLSQIPREEIRVCIAEDNPINQKIAVSFVTKLGLQCEAYNDGQQAVDALRLKSKEGKPFHLVLMDVQMPVLDGYNATRAIRSDEDYNVRGVLVIAMTASAIRGDREKCLEAGMNNYLAKPVRAAVLKSMLEEYLSQTPQGIQQVTKNVKKEVLKTPRNENGTVENREAKEANSPKSPARPRKPKKQTTLTDKDMNKANTDAMTTILEAEKRAGDVDSKEVTVRTRDVSERKRTPNGTPNGSVNALVKPNAVEGKAT